MIKSMTGFGTAKGSSGKIDISVEIRSVNSRYFDSSVKIPRLYMMLEEPVKTLLQKYISRGKIDIFITLDTSKSDDVDVKINRPLAEAYVSALKELAKEYDVEDNIGVIELARFPDVLQIEKREIELDLLSGDVCKTVEEALSEFDIMRKNEGEKLCVDISNRLNIIEDLVKSIEKISPKSIKEYISKLEARMQEVLNVKDYDDQRILMEAAIFAERVAINEETVRLKSHITQLRDMLKSPEPVGRKIDFIVQEFNREANTIGSKGNDTQMAKLVVELKSEIEKIREQAQNIE